MKMLERSVWVVAWLPCAALLACGSSDSGSTGSADGGGTDGSVPGMDGGSGDGGTTADAAAGDGGVVATSYVELITQYANGSVQGTALAGFFSTDGGTSCTTALSMPPCSQIVCTITTAPPGNSAGTVTVTGGDFPVSMQPNASGYYEQRRADGGRAFEPGAMLVASASGAVVPAFSQSITAPSDILLTTPTPGPIDAGADAGSVTGYAIDTSADLSLSWTGGETGTLAEIELAIVRAGQETIVGCGFDATAQHGTIPKQLLTGLAGVVDGTFIGGAYRTTTFQVGPYGASLEAFTVHEGQAAFF